MRRAGFTLAETIVAMSLFALAATALCHAALNARMGLMRLDRKDAMLERINWVRDDILAITDRKQLEEGGEIKIAPHVRKTPKEGDETEASADEAILARWEAEIAPTPVLDVHQLTIMLSFEQGEELLEPQTASYYVYRPDWYEAEGRESLLTEKRTAWERRQTERGLR